MDLESRHVHIPQYDHSIATVNVMYYLSAHARFGGGAVFCEYSSNRPVILAYFLGGNENTSHYTRWWMAGGGNLDDWSCL